MIWIASFTIGLCSFLGASILFEVVAKEKKLFPSLIALSMLAVFLMFEGYGVLCYARFIGIKGGVVSAIEDCRKQLTR
jgi:hypothetical protein